MSTTIISIGGGYNAQSNSLVPVASKFNAAISTNLIQAYVNSTITPPITASTTGLINNDVATGTAYGYSTDGVDTDTTAGAASQSFNASVGGAGIYEITNTDSSGGVVAGPPIGNPYTVTGGSTSFIAQEGGDYTVRGASATKFVLLGAYSNVHYSVIDPDAGSIFAAGGSNLINLDYDGQGATNAETVYSAGHDYINAFGAGNDVVSVESGADDTVAIFSGVTTVTADGNATVSVIFLEQAGGNLDFINNSTTAQTVFSGAYTTSGGANVYAPNSVTAFGGLGGGFYAGGKSGNNSLVGGSGDVTLLGGGSNDFLSASGGASGTNVLEAGNGIESLFAGSGTATNSFDLGVPNAGQSVTVQGIASSDGSGTQFFIIGNANGETITGSTASGAYNYYAVIGDSTTGASNFTITDFGSSTGEIFLTDSSDFYAGNASVSQVVSDPFSVGNSPGGSSTQIQLTDGTVITLKGVAIGNVSYTNPNGTTAGSISFT